jgi:hypothetical protein
MSKFTEPCHANKATIELVKWNQLEKGDYILHSNVPVRVTGPPKAPNLKVKVFQWDDFTMDLGPWNYYYKVVEVQELEWLCLSCLKPVEEAKFVCEDCREADTKDPFMEGEDDE